MASENGSEAESSVVYGGIRTFPMFWVYKRYLTLGCGDHAHLTLTLGKRPRPNRDFHSLSPFPVYVYGVFRGLIR